MKIAAKSLLLTCALLAPLLTGRSPTAHAQAPQALDVAHYDVELTLEPEQRRAQVAARVQIAHAPRQPIWLHAQDLDPTQVTDAQGAPLRFERLQGGLRIWAPACQGGPCTLELRYTLEDKGLMITPQRAQALYHTRAWLVSHDEPSDRATWALRACIPSTWTLVASGQAQGAAQSCGPGQLRHSWRSQAPLAPFLMGFVAAPMQTWADQHQGVDLRICAAPRDEALARLVRALTPDALDFLAQQAGGPLPTPGYTQVITPDKAAQEMGGFAALGQHWLQQLARDPREDWLVIHELAHQWWGVSLTMEDWSHFWLHEGISSYMVAAWKEHRLGHEAYLGEVAQWHKRLGRLREAGRMRPLVDPSRRLSSPERRPLDYWLGALVLHRLREVLGPEAFARGLASFTQEHQGQPVNSDDLRDSMERASGASLRGFFDRWVYGSPLPQVRYHLEVGPDTVTLRTHSDHQARHGPLALRVTLEDLQGRTSRTLPLAPGEQSFTWPIQAPLRAIQVDPDHTLPWLTAE